MSEKSVSEKKFFCIDNTTRIGHHSELINLETINLESMNSETVNFEFTNLNRQTFRDVS